MNSQLVSVNFVLIRKARVKKQVYREGEINFKQEFVVLVNEARHALNHFMIFFYHFVSLKDFCLFPIVPIQVINHYETL